MQTIKSTDDVFTILTTYFGGRIVYLDSVVCTAIAKCF